MRLFPLLYIGFRNLKVDPLNGLAATHNFNTAQKVFKIIQNAAGSLQEAGQPVRDVMYKLLYNKCIYLFEFTVDRLACAPKGLLIERPS